MLSLIESYYVNNKYNRMIKVVEFAMNIHLQVTFHSIHIADELKENSNINRIAYTSLCCQPGMTYQQQQKNFLEGFVLKNIML